MSATCFIESRTAATDHLCTQCGGEIGRGDTYKREAVPPWAMHGRDEEGHWVDYGDGTWLVIRRCYYCIGAV